jgi:hypothetical protein
MDLFSFIGNLIILILLFTIQHFITRMLRPDLVNFISSFILLFIGINFVDNVYSQPSILGLIYKLLVVIIPVLYIFVSFSSINPFKHDLIEYRKQFTLHLVMLLFVLFPFIVLFQPLSLYILIIYQIIFVISVLFSECIWFIPKSYRFEFKKREVKRLRDVFGNRNLFIMEFFLDKLRYEFRIIRKLVYKVKVNFILIFIILFVTAFLLDSNLFNLIQEEYPLILWLLMGIQFFFIMRFLYNGLLTIIVSSFLIAVKTLVFIGEFILTHPIVLLIGGLMTALIWYEWGYISLLIVISITISSIYVYYLYNIHKSRYIPSRNIIMKIIGGVRSKNFTICSDEKNRTYYLSMSIITLLWFATLYLVLILLPIPSHLIKLPLHPVLITLAYFAFRFLFLILRADFWYLFIVFSSPVFLFFLNSYVLYHYSLALNNNFLILYLSRIDLRALLTLVELFIFFIFIIRTANIETIDSIKRALSLFFIIATASVIILRFVPDLFIFSISSSADLTSKDIEEINRHFSVFKNISEWSFIPSIIGSIVGTIYIDLKKKRLEEEEQKKERRLIRALVSKSYPLHELK